jgi:hypothetical protein
MLDLEFFPTDVVVDIGGVGVNKLIKRTVTNLLNFYRQIGFVLSNNLM